MSDQSVDRREFTKTLALGASLVPGLTWKEALPAEKSEKADAPPAEEPRSLADLVLEQLGRRHPDDRLTEAVLGNIRSDIEDDLARSRTLRRFPLKNGDEPAFVFAAYRSDGPGKTSSAIE